MNPLRLLDERIRHWNGNRRRLKEIRASLPETIDLMALIMQAGLDFQVALDWTVRESPPGALRDEFARLQQEIRVGVPRLDAIRHLSARVPEPSIRELVQTIVQGLELGASLGPLLRSQAQSLRFQRSCEAEKKAAQAPLKLLLPLLMFIFPSLLIVLLGPVLLTALQGGPK